MHRIQLCIIVLTGLLILLIQTESISQTMDDLSELSLEELLSVKVEVASSQNDDIFSTPSTVSVIDREMINEFNIKSVAEAINLVAGVSNLRTYLKRNLPTSRGVLQDHYANKVLVMINGVSSWHGGTGEGNLDRVNINDVERIEILKGPASVLYGTNAYSGAINIVLKKAEEKNTNVHFGTGDMGYFEGGGNFSYNSDDYRVFVSGNSSVESGQDYKFTDEKDVSGHINEYIKSSNFNLSLGYKSHSVFVNTYRVDESYLGVTPTFSGGAGNNHALTGYIADYAFKTDLGDMVEFKADGSYDWNKRDLSRTDDDNTRAYIEGYRVSGKAMFIITPSDSWLFEAGASAESRTSVEYSNVDVINDVELTDNNLKDKSVSEFSLFGQARYIYEPFNVLAGVRYTNNELFGSNIASRFSLVYKINDKNSLKFIYGSSYRAPSLFELYFTTSSYTVFGNENLEPEKSNSFELTYLTSFDKFFIQALVYHAQYDNKIYRTVRNVTLDDGTVLENKSIYDNGNTFNANGVELEIKYKNPGFVNAFLNYRYLDGDNGDEENGNGNYNFKYVPQHTAAIGLSKSISAVRLSAMMNYTGKTEGAIDPINAQITFDAGVSYTQKLENMKLVHTVSVKDITDEHVLIPEYVRKKVLNTVSNGYGRRISYTLSVNL